MTWTKILHERVLEHAIGVGRLQIGEQETERALRHILQHLFDLLGTEVSRDLLEDGLSFQPVRRAGQTKTAVRLTRMILANALNFCVATYKLPPDGFESQELR